MNWEKYKLISWFSLGNRKRLKFLYVDTQSHYTSHIDEAFKWRLDDWGRTASPSCASFYSQRRTRNASNWWQSARDEAATWIVYVTSVSVWFQSKRKTEERENATRFKKLPSLLPAPFFERSLTLVPRSFRRNRTETLATQATTWVFQASQWATSDSRCWMKFVYSWHSIYR